MILAAHLFLFVFITTLRCLFSFLDTCLPFFKFINIIYIAKQRLDHTPPLSIIKKLKITK